MAYSISYTLATIHSLLKDKQLLRILVSKNTKLASGKLSSPHARE